MKVTFVREDGIAKWPHKDISLDENISQLCKDVQTVLGLPENPPCRVLLKRTNKEINNGVTFKEAGIQSDDILILISPPSSKVRNPDSEVSRSQSSGKFELIENSEKFDSSSLVRYTLVLKIVGYINQTLEYPIDLEERHEDFPEQFFTEEERQKIEKALQVQLLEELESFKIDKILRYWCDDIALGYRTTSVEISVSSPWDE